jgi:Zn-dependent M28 family amino/carboxypeptidase
MFGRQVAMQQRERFAFGIGGTGGPPVLSVPARAVESVLAAGLESSSFNGLREAVTLVTRELAAVQLTVSVRDEPGAVPTAPNVVGIVEGSDPQLRDQYIVFSAHMDHVGVNAAAKGDSIWNGADDDASGTAGILELAEAFTHPSARPRRSIILLTVSGEEKGLWGSAHFTATPPVPIAAIVANINMDMIGRNWRDTIVAIGKEHSSLGTMLDRVVREHPELRMKAIDDLWPNENFYFRSDHYNFARRGIPALFFFNGTHADYHQASDSPEKIDAEKESRILKLLFHLGIAIANDPDRPKWNAESYRRIVQ